MKVCDASPRYRSAWVPACAGMTEDEGLRRNRGSHCVWAGWVPTETKPLTKNIRRDDESCLIGVVNGNKIARISGRFFVGQQNRESVLFLFQCAQVICFPTGHNVH